MISIIRAAVRQLVSRRSIRVLYAIAVLNVVTAGVWVFVVSEDRPPFDDPRVSAAVENCERAQAETEENARRLGEPVPEFGFDCSPEPYVGLFDKRYHYGQIMLDLTRGIGIVGGVLAFIVGASFAGAVMGTGFVMTELTWQPSRTKLLLGKLGAAFVVTAVVGAVLMAFFAVALLPSGLWRGTMTGVDGAFWSDMASLWARSGALAGMAGVIGVALVTILRTTAAAVGGGLAYFGLIDGLLSAWRSNFGDGPLREWVFQTNIPPLMGVEVRRSFRPNFDPSQFAFEGPTSFGFDTSNIGLITAWRASALLTFYALVLIGLAWVAFTRRDFT